MLKQKMSQSVPIFLLTVYLHPSLEFASINFPREIVKNQKKIV